MEGSRVCFKVEIGVGVPVGAGGLFHWRLRHDNSQDAVTLSGGQVVESGVHLLEEIGPIFSAEQGERSFE